MIMGTEAREDAMDIGRLYEKLAAPAQRALMGLGLKDVEDLSAYSKEQIARLHGIGPGALKIMEAEMKKLALSFKSPRAKNESEARDNPTSTDEYIAAFPEDVRIRLQEIRKIIRQAAPEATEKISYRMPTFFYHGNLVHFAAFAKHIGFYPTPSGISEFAADLKPYVNAKGSAQFPLDKPLPLDLIRRIVEYRYKENGGKKKMK